MELYAVGSLVVPFWDYLFRILNTSHKKGTAKEPMGVPCLNYSIKANELYGDLRRMGRSQRAGLVLLYLP